MGHLQIIVTAGTALMAVMAALIRIRASDHPTSAKKILIPPLGMSTGYLMFLFPPTQIPWTWGLGAFITGVILFSYPLIQTSHFQVIDGQIYLKRSKAFIVILFTLLAIRMLAHNYVEHLVSLPQTAGLFFNLAFGMLLPWRVFMYIRYRKLWSKIHHSTSLRG